ncbi:Transcriptional regulator, AraC family [Marinobacterium lacunae]|uniref:Transcriptional regulator, AraC family n=1 Tax=Marinobacterium lacunae TaxID=1232683 RepID=A0A081G3Y8_9GAMM|nr:AraC family transcriptional regulator [Marinobacterium lacunae]KEA65493.1 Transcriptional regulator, AraC family [Marinobacterium lacunae]
MKPCLELRSYRDEIDRHSHGYHQLILPLSGTLALEIDGHQGTVEAHRCAVIHTGAEHCFQAKGGNRFLVADLPLMAEDKIEQLPAFLSLNGESLEYAEFLARLLSNGKLTAPLQQSSSHLLIDLLLTSNTLASPAIDQRILAVRNYIDQHFSDPIPLSTLGSLVHLSQRQLNTLFRREYGCSPSDYLLRVRMEHARSWLISSEDSIQRVAERSGYSNLAAFSDRFKRHFGLSPRHYRSSIIH